MQHKAVWSELLDKTFKVNVSTHALRCIDKKGGLDNYLLRTRDKYLDDGLSKWLKNKLQQEYKAKFGHYFSRSKWAYEERLQRVALSVAKKQGKNTKPTSKPPTSSA